VERGRGGCPRGKGNVALDEACRIRRRRRILPRTRQPRGLPKISHRRIRKHSSYRHPGRPHTHMPRVRAHDGPRSCKRQSGENLAAESFHMFFLNVRELGVAQLSACGGVPLAFRRRSGRRWWRVVGEESRVGRWGGGASQALADPPPPKGNAPSNHEASAPSESPSPTHKSSLLPPPSTALPSPNAPCTCPSRPPYLQDRDFRRACSKIFAYASFGRL